MKKVTVTVIESLERYQCDLCKKNWQTSSQAERCEERHQKMEELAKAVGSIVKWIIEDGNTAEGQIESVNKQDQYLFATNTRGERIRVDLNAIRYLDNEWFCLKN